jgi:hypothetical protein
MKGNKFWEPTKLDSLQKESLLISYKFYSANNDYRNKLFLRNSLELRKFHQRAFWKATDMPKTEELESHQNNKLIRFNKIKKAIYPICYTNNYCRFIPPKIPNQV